jgi:U4/U6.U5 tri-snRNP-associated protein 3
VDVCVTELSASELKMMRAMGLPVGFDTTKGKQVEGTDVGAAKVIKKRRYRQYMNRPNGFNRPLDDK